MYINVKKDYIVNILSYTFSCLWKCLDMYRFILHTKNGLTTIINVLYIIVFQKDAQHIRSTVVICVKMNENSVEWRECSVRI